MVDENSGEDERELITRDEFTSERKQGDSCQITNATAMIPVIGLFAVVVQGFQIYPVKVTSQRKISYVCELWHEAEIFLLNSNFAYELRVARFRSKLLYQRVLQRYRYYLSRDSTSFWDIYFYNISFVIVP